MAKPPGQPRVHAILKEICPALTRLKLSLHHDTVETLITDPLMSAVVDNFPSLPSLQTFEADIHLDAHCRRLNWRSAMRNAGVRHAAWTKLDDALSDLDGLKEVRVRFHIEYIDKGWLVVTREAAEGIKGHILDTVYPSQFKSLCRKRDRAAVEFEFAVNLTAL